MFRSCVIYDSSFIYLLIHNLFHVVNAMVVSRSWIGGIFSCTNTRRSSSEKFVNYPLRPVEEEKLQGLQEQLQVPYDETCSDHQIMLITITIKGRSNVQGSHHPLSVHSRCIAALP
ncbi:PREDICTED: uncharacterized protein LOC109351822 [Lupinus angustifolius]|uniref:uncharacterized protein LOC109351822 n=1 Tax=Lupinus angustifolius TaxID=3871 RepID=UPI00092EEF0C|nr:PREDICTED: uncharacterized protein LOC109351822 [Lupinus angustifolius]